MRHSVPIPTHAHPQRSRVPSAPLDSHFYSTLCQDQVSRMCTIITHTMEPCCLHGHDLCLAAAPVRATDELPRMSTAECR